MATKKITMKQKTSQGYDILHPSTIIEQVDGLQSALDAKLAKDFTGLTGKTSVNDNDLIAINDSASSNAPKSIKASVLKNYVQDPHNKGYFATAAALRQAIPEGENGDFAVVGETDTIWVWDGDSEAWVDSDTKGQVTSVNGETGDVTVATPGTLTCGDQTPESMASNITLAKVAKTGSYNDLSNTPTIQKIVIASSEPTLNVGDFWYEEL